MSVLQNSLSVPLLNWTVGPGSGFLQPNVGVMINSPITFGLTGTYAVLGATYAISAYGTGYAINAIPGNSIRYNDGSFSSVTATSTNSSITLLCVDATTFIWTVLSLTGTISFT